MYYASPPPCPTVFDDPADPEDIGDVDAPETLGDPTLVPGDWMCVVGLLTVMPWLLNKRQGFCGFPAVFSSMVAWEQMQHLQRKQPYLMEQW